MASFRLAQAVRLRRDCIFSDGSMLKAGHIGVVLEVYPGGDAYQVKFASRAKVEKMRTEELEPIGRMRGIMMQYGHPKEEGGQGAVC